MENLDDVQGYLILAALEADKLYDGDNTPDQQIAELENAIHQALDKIEQLKN